MHKSTGNSIELNDALDRMGADVARWLYCAQPPSQPLRFGYGLADEVKRRLLTFWNSVSFFVTYASIAEFDPSAAAGGAAAARPLARVADRAARARRDRRVRALLDAGRRRWRSSRTWRISRTGTSAGRGGASGTTTPAALRALYDVADAGASRGRAGHAVPRRPPLAAPRRSRRVGAPRAVARGRRGRRRRCSRRSPTCGASSSSDAVRATRRG